jgi:hypothetical protein
VKKFSSKIKTFFEDQHYNRWPLLKFWFLIFWIVKRKKWFWKEKIKIGIFEQNQPFR